MKESEGRRADGMNTNPAKQEKGSQPNFMSSSILKVSRWIRLGAARHLDLRGNTFPLVGRGNTDFIPPARLSIDVHIAGRWFVLFVGVSVVRIADVLRDDLEN